MGACWIAQILDGSSLLIPRKIDFIPTASCIFTTSSLSYIAAHVAKGTFRLKVQIVVSMIDTI